MNRTRWMLVAGLIVSLTSAAWAAPLNESFDETLFPPPAWQSLETGDGANLWIRTQLYPHTGSGLAQSTEEELAGGLVAQRWLITPKLSVGSATDSVVFWVRTLYSFVSDNDSLFVLLSTTDSLPASFTVQLLGLKCGELGDFINVYTRFAANLGSYNGDSVFVAFLHRDEGDDGNRLYLDDVTGPEAIAPPYQAKTPSPANHAVGVAANTNLSWVNGTGTSTIDLYFAQTYDSVNTSIAAAKKIDNVLATSYDPPWDLLANQQYFWKVVTRNAYGQTQGSVWDFTVTGAPLAGSYDIGGGANNYPNFTTAVAALYGNGISGSVTFNVYGGDYNEQVKLLGPIPGATPADSVKFFDASGTARLRVTTKLPTSEGVIHDSLASNLIWDGIDVYLDHPRDSTFRSLVMKGAKNCIFRNASFRGAGARNSGILSAVYMTYRACSSNVFENIHFYRSNSLFYVSGSATYKHFNNVVRNCTIDSVANVFYLTYTPNFQICDNDIQLNGTGVSGQYGVDVYTQASGDTVKIYRNKFHNLNSTGSSSCIRAYQGAGAILNVYNNFFYDVQTTGTASPYFALYAATGGTTNFDFNSVRINDVASTGIVRGIYQASTSAILNIRNNIFYSAEATAQTDIFSGLSGTYLPTILDYNAYYNAGANASFSVYRAGTAYATVAALQAGTIYEDHGLEGDPGFTSATDLHIQNTYNLVSNIGLPITGIDDDIDQNPRSVGNPDIGADEYTYLAPPADYAVTEMLNVIYLNPELTLLHPRARVVNRGSAAQTNAPVVLFYSGAVQDTVLVSLAVDEVDTIEFDWTTPAAPQTGTLEAQSFLAGDADLTNDSVLFAVRIVGQPMHDTYDIGGGSNHYSNFSSAVADITLRGMDGAVIFDVYGTSYTDSLHIGPITGASATNTITFREHVTALDEPVVLTWASGQAVVRLIGADYVIIDGIDITATGTCLRGVQIYSNADYNTVKNGAITGSGVSLTTTYGVHVQASSSGNDYNRFENLTLRGSQYGIRLDGHSAAADVQNEITGCSALEAKYCVYADSQDGARVHDCDFQPGWSGAATEVYGIFSTSQAAGDTIFLYSNRVHNIRTSAANASNGIYCTGVAASGPIWVYNNFVWDFQATGTGAVYAIRVAGGNAQVYFNSVFIGDVATTGGTAITAHINGFYIAGTSTAIVKNNIFRLDEPTDSCFAINRNAGTLTASDYNCVYSFGPGTRYFMGRDGTTNYSNLAAWQGGTVYDDNSLEGNPGYLSPANLHIAATYNLLESEGTPVGVIGFDIDNEARSGTPDIGADEYTYTTFAHDYGVIRFIGLLPTYIGETPYVIQAEVRNWGTNDETDVPVRLYYNNSPQDTVLVTLLAGELDTVNLDWTPPNIGYEIGELKAKAFCPDDGYPPNDSMTAEVIVIGGPMSGVYDLGGGDMEFATFAEAVAAVYLRGMDAEVIFDVYGGTYNENVNLTNPITGASFTDRVIFRNHQTPLNDVVTLTSSTSTPVVLIDSTDYVTFDGIDMVGTGGCDTMVVIRHDADYITLKNLRVTGRDSTVTASRGIKVWFNRNDYCTIDNVTITGVGRGITGEGGSGQSDNLEVKNCHISGMSYCVYLDDMHNARVHDNDLQPKGYASTSAYGVYVASLTSGDTAYVYNNRIHNLRHTATTGFATVAGIYTSANAMVYIFNNFIWDWQTAGPIIVGIYLSTGTNYCGFNSIRINDTENLVAQKSGLYVAVGTTVAGNNIIVIEETADTCYGIWRASGTLSASDYNCFRGVSPWYYVGRDVATLYATLPEWQVLGRDLNSLTGDPGFISASDLHIDSNYVLVNNVGLYVAEVQTDIDGQTRNNPPDIGADEYHGLITPDVVDSLTIFPDAEAGDAVLRWTPSAEANSYKIYRGTVYGFVIDGTTYVNQTAATTYTDVGALSLGVRIYYVVIASTDHIAR